MGQGMFAANGPNQVVLFQQGAGFNCDCGPARFSSHQAAADGRLLSHGLTPQEIHGKINGLNAQMSKVLGNPCKVIAAMIIALMLFGPAVSLTAALANRGEEEHHGEIAHKGEDGSGCKWHRVCKAHELEAPDENRCCGFYCCSDIDTTLRANQSAESKLTYEGEDAAWDYMGPFWADPEEVDTELCPVMTPNNTLFTLTLLSGDAFDEWRWEFPEEVKGTTRTLQQWVERDESLEYGCNCYINYVMEDRKHGPQAVVSCDKLLVTGEYELRREMGDGECRGCWAFILILPLIFAIIACPMMYLIKKKQDAHRMIVNYFADWRQRGIISKVMYFGGSKHSQARLILYLNNHGGQQQMVMLNNPGQVHIAQQQQQQHIMVTVPAGVGAGAQLEVQANGVTLRVTVPSGIAPGQQFAVAMPAVQQQPGVVLASSLPTVPPVQPLQAKAARPIQLQPQPIVANGGATVHPMVVSATPIGDNGPMVQPIAVMPVRGNQVSPVAQPFSAQPGAQLPTPPPPSSNI